ncbi:MAG: type IV pilin N-terminal domain-containing protein [Methanosarcinaceae archaeon]|nr:type IV pilin N-terminal domain-containing protein [Methanosarcinaceae archaeon]
MLNLKSLFKDKAAVSPVIGVALMVGITVILAAAIGSSVLSQKTTEPAPQLHLNIEVVNSSSSTTVPASLRLEHLGGDPISFKSNETTKIILTKDSVRYEIAASDNLNYRTSNPTKYPTKLGTLYVGDSKVLNLYTYGDLASGNNAKDLTDIKAGTVANFKIIDVATNQLIVNKDIQF